MVKLKNNFQDYTELEFLDFLTDICEVNSRSEAEHNSWIEHFEKISEHPMGTDLIFYPLPNADSSPQGIVNTIKQWRAANGKPGFKTE